MKELISKTVPDNIRIKEPLKVEDPLCKYKYMYCRTSVVLVNYLLVRHCDF